MVSHEKLLGLLSGATRVTFSRPYDKETPHLTVVALTDSKFPYQARRNTQDKVFHTAIYDLRAFVTEQLPLWREIHIFGEKQYSALLAKGNVISIKDLGPSTVQAQTHNKTKRYILEEGEDIPIFVKLGIFTKTGKVAADKQDKFRQINRYIELLGDVLRGYHSGDHIEVADYGCGKSYLSFGVYYYLTRKKGLDVTLTGVDLKADVMANMNALAQEYGYSGMHFVAGDIREHAVPNLDLVISLHACDVATDYVLYNAISTGVKHIVSAPCCQHEWNKQMNHDFLPTANRHGILRERLSALLTDAVRVLLLEMCGYKVDIVEFVDLSDSPKNLLIRATKTQANPNPAKMAELQDLLARCGVRPTLYKLLVQDERFAALLKIE